MQRTHFERLEREGVLEDRDLDELDRYLGHAIADGSSLDELASSYELIVADTLREQMFFRRHGRYRYNRFADVADSVYFDDAYMSRYMRGLAITAFLWPNHVAIRKFFVDTVARLALAKERAREPRRYLEVGPGHGFYLMAAMRAKVCEHYEGVDLSPTSVELTRRILEGGSFGHFERDLYSVREADFLRYEHDETMPYDLVVMGEVLEHVEKPRWFLEKARDATGKDGQIFVTTCINSPALDHIYLFESVATVEALFAEARLVVVERRVYPYQGATLERSTAERLPVNVAYLLAPAPRGAA